MTDRDFTPPPLGQGSTGMGKQWVNTNTRAAANRGFQRIIAANPDAGPGLERVIQDYPTLSRETVAAIAATPQVNMLPPQLLDDLAEADRRKQAEALSEQAWFRTIKATSRRAFVVAEDLYNVSPLFMLPRTGINMYQGKSLKEAATLSSETAMGTEIQAGRLGFQTDYGSGFIPSQELTPQDPYFWAHVKQQLLEGTFSGSTEEQIIKATNNAQIEQVRRQGFNPQALATEARNSTLISRTIDGVNYARPYSPGASVMMPFTTPGTRAYDTFSGLVDGVMRVTMEPIDIPFDNAGDVIMAGLNPRVTRDAMTVMRRGSALMQDVLKEAYNVDVVLDPIMLRTPTGGMDEAKGVTRSVIDPKTGELTIEINPIRTSEAHQTRIQQATNASNEWDTSTVYGRAYADRGITPDEVRLEIQAKGGEEAEFFLTMEHELVHAREQKKWFGTTTFDDGTVVVNYEDVLDSAPQELKDAAKRLKETEYDLPRLEGLNNAVNEADDAVTKITEAQAWMDKRLASGELSEASAKAMRGEREVLDKQLVKATKRQEAATNEMLTAYEGREAVKNGIRDYQEIHAINTAWDRMKSGKWEAPAVYKKYKRRAGLTNLMRPWVSPKSVTQWLQSGLGKRTTEYLAGITDIETIRKRAKYLSGEDLLKIADATEAGDVAKVIQDAFNGTGISAIQRPTVGMFTDSMSQGLDAWKKTTQFIGGPIGSAAAHMGIYARRSRASVGNHILSMTDLDSTLDSINSFLATVGATADEINAVQRMAIDGHGTTTGLDRVYERIEEISKKRLKDQANGIYTTAEVDKIWSDWRGYDIVNRHYWASNAGKDRNWAWTGKKFTHVSEMQAPGMRPTAFMETQFAETHRVLPDIRRTRRLYSQQRRGYETVRKMLTQNSDPSKANWSPQGFDTTGIMGAGDWSFGLWRDLQLMRGGWAMRILPEEQLRFGASGFSGMFSNPIDYFLTMFNKLEFTVPGDNITLAQLMKTQEALGTGGLRDLRYPPHMIVGDSWDLAVRAQHPQQFWGGLSREYLMSSQDQIVSRVARMGPEEAKVFFGTEEGQSILRQIAQDASQDNPLSHIVRHEDALQTAIDVSELRVAQVTGGEGLWFDETVGEYVDLWDNPKPRASNKMAFPNEESILSEIVILNGGDQSSTIGLSHRSRADLEAALNEARGYNLDELHAEHRAAVVTREGNPELRSLIGNQQLDDMAITPEMPYHEIRAFDQKLEAAYASRNVEPPPTWPVAKGELDDAAGGSFRNEKTDLFFKWFNQVPSKLLNRQPFFQQSFGAKLAESYYYGDTKLRNALDEVMAQNPSLRVAFDVGSRKVYRDFGVTKMPRAFDGLDLNEVRKIDNIIDETAPPMSLYQDAVDDGRYDRIPLQNDPEEFVTAALTEALRQVGVVEGVPTRPRGVYTQRNDRVNTDYAGFPTLVFTGSATRQPAGRFLDWQDLNKYEPGGLDPQVPFKSLEEEAAVGIAYRHRADPESVTDEELLTAARELGWAEQHSSGGIGELPYRTSVHETETGKGYGEYTDIMRTDHLEPDLQAQIINEGDIEQMFAISPERWPALAEIKDEIVPIWNEVRNDTRFKLNPNTVRRTMGDTPTAMEQEFLFFLDDLEKSLPPQTAVPDEMFDRSNERLTAVKDWMDNTFGPGGGASKDGQFETLLHYAREHGALKLDGVDPQKLYWSNVQGDQLMREYLAEGLLDYFDDPLFVKGRSVQWPMIQKMIEQKLGRELTPAQVDEFTRKGAGKMGNGIYQRRAYLPEEILLGYEPIQPVGRLHRDAIEGLMEHGIMAENPRMVGDAALLIDRNTMRVNQTLSQGLPHPYQDALPEILDDTLGGRRRKWADFIFQSDGPNAYSGEMLRNVEKQLDDLLTQTPPKGNSLFMTDFEGAHIRMDFGAWMASPNFRGFAYEARDEAQKLKEDISLFLQKNHSMEGAMYFPLGAKVSEDEFVALVTRMLEAEKSSALVKSGGRYKGSRTGSEAIPWKDELDDMLEQYRDAPIEMAQNVDFHVDDLQRDVRAYEDGAVMLDTGFSGPALTEQFEFNLGRREPTPKAAAGEIKLNFDDVPQQQRNEAAERVFGAPNDGSRYDWGETGGPDRYTSEPTTIQQVEELMKAAKNDAIEETKDLFYDLTNKSNVADAMKFIFPFGDAWYEVLSRWAKIMNPVQSGGQSFRNVRRVQQVWDASRDSGFLSTNDYGEEVFNWPISPGNIANAFIPNEANLGLKGSMPVSSLMFIDPTARGIISPGTSPIIQLAAQYMAPHADNMPLLGESLQWMAYGGKDEYRPGGIEELSDVQQGFFPTTVNRIAALVFDEQQREAMGNTKLRLFQSLGVSGDEKYNFTDPAGAQAAWDTASTVGTWLTLLRIGDAWLMPGQPQYSPTFQGVEVESTKLTMEQILEGAADETVEQQAQIVTILRASAEYRQAREIFGDAEADMYMIERYGVLPSFLQSASTGLVQRPVTWGGVEHLDNNEWLYDAAPLTLVGTVPADADETFSSQAWNNLFGEFLELEGIENQPIRRPKSPSELHQDIVRGMGYDQVRFQNEIYDRQLLELREGYGPKYASMDGYRAKKNELDRIKRANIEQIYTEFKIIRASNQGAVVGSTQGVTTRMMVDEVIDIGTRGTEANSQFNTHLPELAPVAEQYASWFNKMEAYSRMQDNGKAGGEWWMNAESDDGEMIRMILAKQASDYLEGLEDPNAIAYAKWLNRSLLDQLIKEWEWIDSKWVPELESFPSIEAGDAVVVGGSG